MNATKQFLEIAFKKLGLHKVYLNVLKNNLRANAFYKKARVNFDYCAEKAIEIPNLEKRI